MNEQYQIASGADARKQARFVSALLIIAAAAVGILFVARALRSRQARIEETQEEIAALLDKLDPLARVQVAEYVVEREAAKYGKGTVE